MPEERLQKINNDIILEVTESIPVTKRYSQKDLLRNKAYFEEMFITAQTGLDDINAKLAQIENVQTYQAQIITPIE